MDQKKVITIIYAAEDLSKVTSLKDHLQPFYDHGSIVIWDDSPIATDALWKPSTIWSLEETDVFVLVLSEAFMYSKFVGQQEFKQVIDRHKQGRSAVIPVIIEDCPWDVDFNSDEYDFSFKELRTFPEVISGTSAISVQDAFVHLSEYLKTLVLVDSAKEATPLNDQNLEKQQQEQKAKGTASDEENTTNTMQTPYSEAALSDSQAKTRTENPTETVNTFSERDYGAESVASPTKQKPVSKLVLALLGVGLVSLGAWYLLSIKKAVPSNLDANVPVLHADTTNALKMTIDSSTVKKALTKLVLGSNYSGGIVFAVAADGRSGKMAYVEDLGTMPWKDAAKSGERIGPDWRLPTLEELVAMRNTIGQGADNEGGFSNTLYWSATLYGDYQAKLLHFRNGNATYRYNKEVADRQYQVRPVKDIELK
ncbi:TIR domain-containing protein [Maribacter sp. 2-571]|uniref:TIR domain-containing protein n=1 Tax=Maribacter sp. 2-571 TaxID=3417569 RepID=UPI003D33677E